MHENHQPFAKGDQCRFQCQLFQLLIFCKRDCLCAFHHFYLLSLQNHAYFVVTQDAKKTGNTAVRNVPVMGARILLQGKPMAGDDSIRERFRFTLQKNGAVSDGRSSVILPAAPSLITARSRASNVAYSS
jgi:hypothetical protein